jgi:hypothetical protein
MRIARMGVLVLAPLLMAPGPPAPRMSRIGIVEATVASSCPGATHVLRDPCSGAVTGLISTHVNLNLFLGLHVKVGGRGDGVACDVLEVRTLRLVPQKCAGPEP